MKVYVVKDLTEDERQTLIEECVEQIKEDLSFGDVTAIGELLSSSDNLDLIGFLGSEKGTKYYNEALPEENEK